jgi:hypothetical protein
MGDLVAKRPHAVGRVQYARPVLSQFGMINRLAQGAEIV